MPDFGIADLPGGAGLKELTPRQLHDRGLAWLESAAARADGPAAQARVAQAFFAAARSAADLAARDAAAGQFTARNA
jgi:hypothetical protein